jgi:uncharacterized RmlC-like cupin family protein
MKKIVAIMALVVGMVSTNIAQRATIFPLIAGDTLTTSSSRDTVTKVITATAGYSALGIEVVTTKVSGTVAGKAYLYSSLDGVNYTLTDSSSAFANQTTNVAFFTKTGGLPYVYYKVTVQDAIGGATSTQANIVRVYYVLRRYDN